jgi:hypothetical protein
MAMTVLDIAQAGTAEAGLTVPTSVISSSDPYQIQIRALLYSQARQLRNRRIFPQQKRIYVFNTVSGQSSYQLPQDYYGATTGTAWDDTKKLRLIGPLSDARYTDRTRGLVGGTYTAYRIFGPDNNPYSAGGQFQVSPTPSSVFELSFEYLTSTTFRPTDWQPSAGVTSTNYRFANGNIYYCDTSGTTSATTAPIATTTTTNGINDGTAKWHYIQAGYETIINDFDRSLFDDDVMASGFKWRLKQAKKLDWQEDYEAYSTLLEATIGRWQGSFVGKLDNPQRRGPRYTTADGSWSF